MNTQAAHQRVTSCLLLCGLLLTATPLAASTLSGVLSGNRTLRLADSPVQVPTDLSVPEGVRLNIEAGVELQLAEGVCLIVEGSYRPWASKMLPFAFSPPKKESAGETSSCLAPRMNVGGMRTETGFPRAMPAVCCTASSSAVARFPIWITMVVRSICAVPQV